MKKELSIMNYKLLIQNAFLPIIVVTLGFWLGWMAYFLIHTVIDGCKVIKIEKTAKGYNTYYEDGTLQYEFTKQNTDSLSLETLEMIYEGE